MATIVNARDTLLQASSSRYVNVTVPGSIDWINVTGTGKPFDYADVTQGALQSGVQLSAGGLTLVSGGSVKGGQTAFDLGNGFFMGYSGGAYRFSVGNSAGQSIAWNGTSLTIRGNLDFSYVQNGPPANADNTLSSLNTGLTTSGQITLTTNGHIKAGQTDFAVGTGFFLGYSLNGYKLSIGNSTNFIKWNGTDLQIQGSITGNSSINITGSAIFNGDYNYGGSVWAVVGNPNGAIRGGGRFVGGGSVTGVWGSSTNGFGVLGETGNGGAGVYGRTSGLSSGGTFEAMSTSGSGRALGAYHATTGGINSGVGFECTGRIITRSGGQNDIAMTVSSTGSASGAAKFINEYSSKQFWAAPGAYAAYSPGGGGKYYFVDGIGPFTAFHPGLVEKSSKGYAIGDIVVDDYLVSKADVNNSLTTVKLATSSNNPEALGVISEYVEIDEKLPYPLWWELADFIDTHWLMYVNAIGEGCVNVCGRNGDIHRGDLIVTSDMPGKGMRQDDNVIHNYTVARAREAISFNSPDEVKSCACIYLCG